MAIGLPVKANYAAGDILTATNMNDLSGTFNQVATSYGQAAGKNAIYNSGFDIAQRGTSFTGVAGDAYNLDQWVFWATSGGQSNTVSQQAIGNLSVSPNQAIRYAGRYGRTAGTSNTGGRILFQQLETADSLRFAGQTVTLSFYARAGANYSATSGILGSSIVSGTGTDQKYYNFTGSANVAGINAALTTSWQRFTVSGTVATNATQIALAFVSIPTGTAGAADYFEITGVQLEVGSVATPYSRSGGSIQGELAMCQRYYWRSIGVAAYQNHCLGYANNLTDADFSIPLPVQMRVVPTAIEFSLLGVHLPGIFASTFTNVILGNGSTRNAGNIVGLGASGLTQYRPYFLSNANNSSGYIAFTAEL